MPVLVLEEPRLGHRHTIIASSCDPSLILAFWTTLLEEAQDAVHRLEGEGEEVLAVVERANLERLRRIAPLFGGHLPDGEEAAP
jgi:hypothetical protein